MAKSINASINADVELIWCGFRAHICELVAFGWEILYNELTYDDLYYDRGLSIYIKNAKGDVRGVAYVRIDDMHRIRADHIHIRPRATLEMEFATKILVSAEKYQGASFSTLPVAVTYPPTLDDIKNIGYGRDQIDIILLEPKVNKPKDIIVDPPTVSELLEQIEKMQNPKQKEIRSRMLKDKKLNEMQVQARILTAS